MSTSDNSLSTFHWIPSYPTDLSVPRACSRLLIISLLVMGTLFPVCQLWGLDVQKTINLDIKDCCKEGIKYLSFFLSLCQYVPYIQGRMTILPSPSFIANLIIETFLIVFYVIARLSSSLALVPLIFSLYNVTISL